MGKLISGNKKFKQKIQDLVQRAAKGAAGTGPAGTPSENPEATLPQTPPQAQTEVPQGETTGAPEQTPNGEDARKRRKQQMSNILGIQV